jgi:hypothetical protein
LLNGLAPSAEAIPARFIPSFIPDATAADAAATARNLPRSRFKLGSKEKAARVRGGLKVPNGTA